MKLFSRLFRRQSETRAFQWINGSDVASVGRSPILIAPADRVNRFSTVVMACVNWSMTNITRGEWVFERKDGDDWVRDHPNREAEILSVLNAPLKNGDAPSKDTGRDLLQRFSHQIMLTGNWYLCLYPDNPAGLLEWHSSASMQPRPKNGAINILDSYSKKGARIPAEFVIHAKDGVDPDNPLVGVSRIVSAGRLVLADHEIAAAHHSLLKAPVPSMVVSLPESAQPSMIEAFKKRLMANIGGEERNQPVIVSGDVKIDAHGYKPTDLDTTALAGHSESRIASLFGISPMVLGLGIGLDRSTYSNYDTALEASVRNHLVPLSEILSAALTEQWIKPYWKLGDEWRLRLSFDDLPELQSDIDELHARARENFKANVYDRAQALAMIGDDPRPEDEGIYAWMLGPIQSTPPKEGAAKLRRESERNV